MGFTWRNLLLIAAGVGLFWLGQRMPTDNIGSAILCLGLGAGGIGFYRLAKGKMELMIVYLGAAFIVLLIIPAVPAYFGHWSPLAMYPERIGDHNLAPTGKAALLIAAIMALPYMLAYISKKMKGKKDGKAKSNGH